MASPCSRAEPLPSAGSEKYPSSCCRARRIQALAAWWTLALPVLDRLSGRQPRQAVTLPLARKIASSVGIAEIVLLQVNNGAWMPLAVGDLSLGGHRPRRCMAGTYRAGLRVLLRARRSDAYMLRD